MLAPNVVQPTIALRFDERGRDLPWRKTRDPYAILVSEVMLQQTQAARVVPRWVAWLARWPTVEGLAGAEPAEVIREWQGLGYNRRAVSLQRAARVVAEQGWPKFEMTQWYGLLAPASLAAPAADKLAAAATAVVDVVGSLLNPPPGRTPGPAEDPTRTGPDAGSGKASPTELPTAQSSPRRSAGRRRSAGPRVQRIDLDHGAASDADR